MALCLLLRSCLSSRGNLARLASTVRSYLAEGEVKYPPDLLLLPHLAMSDMGRVWYCRGGGALRASFSLAASSWAPTSSAFRLSNLLHREGSRTGR